MHVQNSHVEETSSPRSDCSADCPALVAGGLHCLLTAQAQPASIDRGRHCRSQLGLLGEERLQEVIFAVQFRRKCSTQDSCINVGELFTESSATSFTCSGDASELPANSSALSLAAPNALCNLLNSCKGKEPLFLWGFRLCSAHGVPLAFA